MADLRSCAAIAFCFGILLNSAMAQSVVDEPARKTPVLYDVDVVVVGGGLSGVGAAIGAARGGAKTLLIERTGYLGGWLRGTGMGNTLAITGWRPALGEGALADIAKKTIEIDPTSLEGILKSYRIQITNPEVVPHAFQALVLEAGAEILYFSTFTDSIVKNGKIEAVIVQTPTGRAAVRGKVFIDCTGLATVAAASGVATKKAASLMGLAAWISGVDVKRAADYVASLPTEPSPEARAWLESKLGFPITTFSSDGPSGMNFPWDDWLTRNANVLGPKFREAVDKGDMPLFYKVGDNGVIGFVEGLKVIDFDITGGISRPRTYITGVDPTNIKDVSDAHIRSSQYLFKLTAFLRNHVPGFEKAQLTRIAETTLNRAGRSVDQAAAGDAFSMQINETAPHDDAILVLKRGDEGGNYEMPYRAVLTDQIENLLAVGKSSVGGIKYRTHMLSVVMGQAAGTAAAIAVRDNVEPRNVSIRKLQLALREAGIRIPRERIEKQ